MGLPHNYTSRVKRIALNINTFTKLKKGLAYFKAGFSLAAVRGALKTAAAAVFNANSTAA